MTEIESHNIDFIEIEFLGNGDTNGSLGLYEEDEVEDLLLSSSEGRELIPNLVIAKDDENNSQSSRSVPDNRSVQLETPPASGSESLDLSDLQVCRSKHGQIPHHHFEIEGDVFMCTPNDDDEPSSMDEALASSTSKEWLAAMQDKFYS